MKHLKTLCALIITIASVLSVHAEESTYTVQRGDTLYGIARKFSLSPQFLMELNDIEDPTVLQIGSTLRLTREEGNYDTYSVLRGDTLYSISRRHGIEIGELCSINGISSDILLKVGMVLKVPAPQATVAEPVKVSEKDVIDGKEGDTSSDGSLLWPHDGERFSLSGKLMGMEISGSEGDNVISVNSGNVVWVAPYRGYGRLVMVEGADNTIYAYGGNEETYVKVGDRVSPGTLLGKVGLHPIEKKAKVFFFVYKDGKPLDPVKAPRG